MERWTLALSMRIDDVSGASSETRWRRRAWESASRSFSSTEVFRRGKDTLTRRTPNSQFLKDSLKRKTQLCAPYWREIWRSVTISSRKQGKMRHYKSNSKKLSTRWKKGTFKQERYKVGLKPAVTLVHQGRKKNERSKNELLRKIRISWRDRVMSYLLLWVSFHLLCWPYVVSTSCPQHWCVFSFGFRFALN